MTSLVYSILDKMPAAKLLLLILIVLFEFPTYGQNNHADSTVPQKRKPDYSYLNSFPEFSTNIFGKVERNSIPGNTQIYPKGLLFSDSFHLINNGATFELLNEDLTPAKSHERILVKILSNPPSNEFVGEIGWIYIKHTSLTRFYDWSRNRVDTNFLYNKYLNAGDKCREDASKTKCPNKKKCLLLWASYYDCMMTGAWLDSPAECPFADCSIEDCPEDK